MRNIARGVNPILVNGPLNLPVRCLQHGTQRPLRHVPIELFGPMVSFCRVTLGLKIYGAKAGL
jgi:hypothetical protein